MLGTTDWMNRLKLYCHLDQGWLNVSLTPPVRQRLTFSKTRPSRPAWQPSRSRWWRWLGRRWSRAPCTRQWRTPTSPCRHSRSCPAERRRGTWCTSCWPEYEWSRVGQTRVAPTKSYRPWTTCSPVTALANSHPSWTRWRGRGRSACCRAWGTGRRRQSSFTGRRRWGHCASTIPYILRRMLRLTVCIFTRPFAASDAFSNAPASSRAGWTSPNPPSPSASPDGDFDGVDVRVVVVRHEGPRVGVLQHKNSYKALHYEKLLVMYVQSNIIAIMTDISDNKHIARLFGIVHHIVPDLRLLWTLPCSPFGGAPQTCLSRGTSWCIYHISEWMHACLLQSLT